MPAQPGIYSGTVIWSGAFHNSPSAAGNSISLTLALEVSVLIKTECPLDLKNNLSIKQMEQKLALLHS